MRGEVSTAILFLWLGHDLTSTPPHSGFNFDLRKVDKEALEEAVVQANNDDSVDGILVYYPIWRNNQQQDRYIQETVALSKDVEGLCHTHLFNMYHNVRFLDPPANQKKSILPCTPLAIVKALEHVQIYNPILAYGNRLFGKTITVINRSEVNGRPLAALLANDGATVYSVDITGVQVFTRGSGIRAPRHQVHDKEGWGLKDVLPLSDVVIAGVPSEAYKVPTDLIRDGAACINFSSYRNFDGPAIKEKASIYVPSTGKVTIAVLLRNLVVCAPFSGVMTERELTASSSQRLIANRPRPEGTSDAAAKARDEAFKDG